MPSAPRSCCRSSPPSSGSTGSRTPPATAKVSARRPGRCSRARRTRRNRWCSRSCTRSPGGRTGCIDFNVGTQVDGLAVMMLFVVTLISLLVHIYSIGVHARRRPLHALLRVLSLFTASMLLLRRRRQHAEMLVGLGAGRPLLVHADRPLVGGEAELRRGPQGVPHHPHRRHRPDHRHDHHVLRRAARRFDIAQHQRVRAQRRASATRCCSLGAICLFIGDHRQVRSVPAAHLAARRHGRPDAGVRADPRRHHGRRRRLPRRPPLPACSSRASRSAPAASTSWRVIGGITIIIGAAARVRAETTSRRCSPTPRSASSATW